MSNLKSVSIKVFLLSGDGKRTKEVRRFPIQVGASICFKHVEQKIINILELDQNKPVQILWEDAEGDRISMSSDDELVEAIAENIAFRKLPTLKLYIIPKVKLSCAIPKVTNIPVSSRWNFPIDEMELAINHHVHVGVICDGCDKDLFGVRFKCIKCPDYDLCSDCKTINIHCMHEFIDLGLPDDDSLIKAWGRFDMRTRRREARNLKRRQSVINYKEYCSGKQKINDDTNSEETNSPGYELPRAKFFESLRNERNPEHFSIYEEKLQSDPLANGVKLTIDVLKNMFNAWAGEFEIAVNSSNAGESSSKAGESSSTAGESSSTAEESASSTNKSTSTSAQEMAEEDVEGLAVRQNPGNKSSLGEEISKLIDANEVEKLSSLEWTMIEEAEVPSASSNVYPVLEEAAAPIPQVSSASSNVYPVLEEAAAPIPQVSSAPQDSLENESSHTKDAIQYLKAMGYSSDEGWLTRLFNSKNGDINKVLDFLMAPRKK